MKKLFILLLFIGITSTANAKVKTEEVKYSSGGAQLTGFLAYDDDVVGKRPGILVVHEWWGHNEHAKNKARKLARMGYTAFALDMYGDGKLADHPEKAGEFMNAAFSDWEGSKAKFREAKKTLQAHRTVDPDKIGAIGFCFGGAVSIRMARGGEDLKAVVAFHSALPDQPAIEKDQVKAAILVINGADDGFLKSDAVAAFTKQMVDGNVDFTYRSLKGVRHSFTNPMADEFSKKFNIPALKYDKQADKTSWRTMHRFFKNVFGR
ncbi:MAG: dienelactone hydrolase [Nitrospinaceae bacterium]|nr:MAG: dienelactone hydrolase [Nitrospinaceae bacterium]